MTIARTALPSSPAGRTFLARRTLRLNGDSFDRQSFVEAQAHEQDEVEFVEPREIPWDAEVQEFSVPADIFTLNYRRSFNELMTRV